jgi:hypothetical protein
MCTPWNYKNFTSTPIWNYKNFISTPIFFTFCTPWFYFFAPLTQNLKQFDLTHFSLQTSLKLKKRNILPPPQRTARLLLFSPWHHTRPPFSTLSLCSVTAWLDSKRKQNNSPKWIHHSSSTVSHPPPSSGHE